MEIEKEEMTDSTIDEDAIFKIPLSLLIDMLALPSSNPDDLPTDSFPKSSKTDQRAKFLSLLEPSLNPHLCDVRSSLVKMLNDGRSSFEIVLFLNLYLKTH